MDLIEEIIASIPGDAPVREIRRGLHWTAVTTKSCGLASTMLRESCPEGQKDATFRLLTDQTGIQLARLALSSDTATASLGLAAINSLLEPDRSRCTEINAADLLMERGRGKKVSIIGHFPFTDEVRAVTEHLWVIEKRQRPGDYGEEDATVYLPQSDIVAISSTTLINHTLLGLLKLCPQKSLKMLLGPTTPMTTLLFDYGIDIISGSFVVDEAAALKYISEGINFRQLKRTGSVKLVTLMKTNI